MEDKQHKIALKIIYAIRKILDAITITCFSGMFIIVLGLVFMRFVMQRPFLWGEEAARYLMVISIFLAFSMGVKEKVHLNVSYFVAKLPAKIEKIVFLLSNFIAFGGYTFLAYLAISFTWRISQLPQRSAALNIPTWVLYLFIAIGFVLCSVESLIIFFGDLRKVIYNKNSESKKNGDQQ